MPHPSGFRFGSAVEKGRSALFCLHNAGCGGQRAAGGNRKYIDIGWIGVGRLGYRLGGRFYRP
jgi:hypothetical protein